MIRDRALQLQAEGIEYDASLYYAIGDRFFLDFAVKGDRALQFQDEGME
ncbi:hypothetical protein [Pleurocapsa sp. PCC 7319]|nr:hypothetical protein [Pleurocapsa sp. PCC 7319]